jgi:hypothetical protein
LNPQQAAGFLFAADGTSLIGPDVENKKRRRLKPPEGSMLKTEDLILPYPRITEAKRK